MNNQEIHNLIAEIQKELQSRQEAQPIEGEVFQIESDQKAEPSAQEEVNTVVVQQPDYSDIPENSEDFIFPEIRQRFIYYPLVIVCIFSLLIGYFSYTFIYPYFFSHATVIITPARYTINKHAVFTQNQISTRQINQSQSNTKTVISTGKVEISSKKARGMINFYNSALTAQFIPEGTILNADSVQIATDQAITIAPAQPPTEGSASVQAHAVMPGTSGNIQANSLTNPRAYIFVFNSAFTGGQDAASYAIPTQKDISSAVASLQDSLSQVIKKQIAQELVPGEQSTAPECTSQVHQSAQPGENASQVTINLKESCSSEAYQKSELDTLAKAYLLASAQAHDKSAQLVSTTIKNIRETLFNNVLTFDIDLNGVYTRSFTEGEKAQIRRQIARQQKAKAYQFLLQMPGIESVQIVSADNLPNEGSINLTVSQ